MAKKLLAAGLMCFEAIRFASGQPAEASVGRPIDPDPRAELQVETGVTIPCGLNPSQHEGAKLLPVILATAGLRCIDVPEEIADEYPGSVFATRDGRIGAVFTDATGLYGEPTYEVSLRGTVTDLTDMGMMIGTNGDMRMFTTNIVEHSDNCLDNSIPVSAQRDLATLGNVLAFMSGHIDTSCLGKEY